MLTVPMINLLFLLALHIAPPFGKHIGRGRE